MTALEHENFSRRFASPALKAFLRRRVTELLALAGLAVTVFVTIATLFYDRADPSLNTASAMAGTATGNPLGAPGALTADLMLQALGPAVLIFMLVPLGLFGRALVHRPARHLRLRLIAAMTGLLLMAGGLAIIAPMLGLNTGFLPAGPGGLAGHVAVAAVGALSGTIALPLAAISIAAAVLTLLGLGAMIWAAALPFAHIPIYRRKAPVAIEDASDTASHRYTAEPEPVIDAAENDAPARSRFAALRRIGPAIGGAVTGLVATLRSRKGAHARRKADDTPAEHIEPTFDLVPARAADTAPADHAEPPWEPVVIDEDAMAAEPARSDRAKAGDTPPAMPTGATSANRVSQAATPAKPGRRAQAEKQPELQLGGKAGPAEDPLPPLHLLYEPKPEDYPARASAEALEQNARMLETVLEDFGIKGEITNVRPGPVVTLYELKPAPGTKSSRVIGLADDIARSMSAISARVAVVPGRDALGIELPNATREVVYLREMLASQAFEKKGGTLGLALGKDIGGEPMFADLAKMPHLLVAGTTGSGKSVAINTFILSLLYRLPPERCRLIMIDPKMLELSIYEGIPHLLTPVVTEPRKAVVALKWAVKEMESRYKRMSELGVRNITAYNKRVDEAEAAGQPITKRVQTGFDPETDMPVYEDVELETQRMPNIVVIVDEMADLMMVAGKDIEGAIQRLAQMARAAGIHLIMATQRPSVDVITGTIKANFPTRISFQVTSKIDSRTILGEMGAEQLLGQGDMLFQPNGSKLLRVHGPFVSDEEVEEVVTYLRRTGRPDYLDAVTDDPEEDGGFDGEGGGGEDADPMFDKAVDVVARTGKASTSFIQRHLKIGYNRAARIIEMMEEQGMVSAANHVGKREVLLRNPDEEM